MNISFDSFLLGFRRHFALLMLFHLNTKGKKIISAAIGRQKMSSFNGKIRQYPWISIDRFDGDNLEAAGYFLCG